MADIERQDVMKYPTWIKPFVALLILLVGSLPVIAYLWLLGRVPTMDANSALKVLNDPLQNAVLVDVRTDKEFLAMHVVGSYNWPAEKIASLQSLEQMPGELKDKELLLICNSGFQSAKAVEKLHSLGAVDAYSMKGGLQKWIAVSKPNSSSLFTKIAYSPSEQSPYRSMTLVQQTAAVFSGFGIKPLHMLLSAVLGFILLRQKAVDLRVFGWAVVIFLIAEIFCAINYLFFDHNSYLAEYLHSYGMALSFAVAAFAIMQGMDDRLLHLSAPEKRCILLPLCRGCVKYNQSACKMRTLFQVSAIAMAVLAFIPLAALPAFNSYVTTIFGTPYNYCRLLLNQYLEGRYLPMVTLIFCLATIVVIRWDSEKEIPAIARVLIAGAIGALSFGMFRLTLGAVFGRALIWADFWEEVTELMFVAFAAVVLWIYREGLLDVPVDRNIFRM
jgi:rhodanese-related sulfurtransferase